MKVRLMILVLASALVVASAPAAHAADELSVSRDGVTWTDDIVDPLFDPDVRWVPGDQRQVRFFVRNASADTGDLTVDILGVEVDDLLETGDLDISARGGDGPFVTVDEPETRRLVTRVLPSAQVETIEVEVAFDPSSDDVSQRKVQDLRLRATLTQASIGDDAVADVSGLLPGTGATREALLILAIGCLLLLAGSAVLAWRGVVRRG